MLAYSAFEKLNEAAHSVVDVIRTALGPNARAKLVVRGSGDVIVSRRWFANSSRSKA